MKNLCSLSLCAVAAVAMALAGCSDDGDPVTQAGGDGGPTGAADAGTDSGGGDGPGTDGPGTTQAALTYSADIQPILHEKCVKCHQTGGIGPFGLDNYENAKSKAKTIAAQTSAGVMPPYLVTHDGTCGDFHAEDTLSAAQIATLQKWAQQADKPEGPPVTLPVVKVPHIEGALKDWKTPTLTPVRAGTPLAKYDEYRCFPLTSDNLDKDAFITGYEVIPGNAQIVHHVVAFLVDPDKVTGSGKKNAEVMQALDATDPDRAGWPCFGLAGEGVEIDAVPVIWAPGQGPVTYPAGIGVQHKKAHTLVVQLHYNLADDKLIGMSDSTAVKFAYADKVDRRGVFVLKDAFLETLSKRDAAGNAAPDVLMPGMASVKYTWKRALPDVLPFLDKVPYVDLVAVMPHMHARGHKKQMDIIDAAGAATCAAKVEDWDFDWQKFYFYKSMPRLTSANQLQLTCDYDTSKEKAPVLPGWGTYNEMCIAILMLALPPGV